MPVMEVGQVWVGMRDRRVRVTVDVPFDRSVVQVVVVPVVVVVFVFVLDGLVLVPVRVSLQEKESIARHEQAERAPLDEGEAFAEADHGRQHAEEGRGGEDHLGAGGTHDLRRLDV